MRTRSGLVLTAALLATAWSLWAQTTIYDPHGDPQSGVLRVTTTPPTRGECIQCHPTHGDPGAAADSPPILFTENTNDFAFWDEGDGLCHRRRPDNYPLTENDRIPEPEVDAGYFEANVSGVRRVGVQFRGRWPGESVWNDPDMTPAGHFYSPHAQDPDMPRRDGAGLGKCLNCHEPHGSANPRDILVASYGGIGGHASVGAPGNYALCLNCHGHSGPAGMDLENRFIEDFYDAGLNGETAGHQIRRDPAIALSWPPHVLEGDMLPCYDCHNPHGSEGGNGVEPNAFLLSDQRPEWSGLTDTKGDPDQCRRFCFGCHIPSDGVAGTKEVEGIIMNTLSGEAGHAFFDTQSCYDCHGRDYTDPRSFNVHNPDR